MCESRRNEMIRAGLQALHFGGQEVPTSPLVLAYVGDAVHELAVRTHLALQGDALVRSLHERAAAQVQAGAQAKVLQKLEPQLTDEERDLIRRARNTKAQVPRSATVFEYRYSTAFEALLGHLFLTGAWDRLLVILEAALAQGEART